MPESSQFLISLDAILLMGLATSELGRRTFLPRVTLLLIFGAFIGKGFLNVIPPVLAKRLNIIAEITLRRVGF